MQTYLSFIPRHQVSNTIVSPYGNNRDLAKPKSRAPGLMSSIFIGKIYLTEVYHDLTSLVFRDISTHMGLSLEGSRPFAMIFFTSEFTSGWSFIARLNWKEISSKNYSKIWTCVTSHLHSYMHHSGIWYGKGFISCSYSGEFKCWLIPRYKAYPVLTHSIWFGLGADLFPETWLNNDLYSLKWKQGIVPLDLWGVYVSNRPLSSS